MTRYDIPCTHEHGEGDGPDYHPIEREEIARLLDIAKTADAMTAASIQYRFEQGIIGMTCPQPGEGQPTERLLSRLDDLYVRRYREGATPDLVEKLYTIMRGEDKR